MLLAVLTVAAVLFLLVMTLLLLQASFMLVAAVSGTPFVPTSHQKVGQMFEIADLQPGDKVIDIGSGDGRFVIYAARQGVEAVGVEINPFLAYWSRLKIKSAGLDNLAKIELGDFRKVNLSHYDAVFVYGVGKMMERLETKIKKELKPGSKVISNFFTFKTLRPTRSQHNIHLYPF